MYKIYADGVLIYDSTLDDYKIGKGEVTLELDKAGSFIFTLYPDHPWYDGFIKLKTVVTVYKGSRIVFRGRVIDEMVDYWNAKTFTCEGELNFLRDSIIRPYTYAGSPAQLFRQIIEDHNTQVDEFKRFNIGTVTVKDPNGRIARSNNGYDSALDNLNSRLIEDATGGHFYITHGDNGQDPTPTLHYLADFGKVATQAIEFGVNLRGFTRADNAEEVATAVIPLGAVVDDGDSETEDPKLTIASVNDGRDYIYSPEGVAQYGWIFRVVEWEDVTEAKNLKKKAEDYLAGLLNPAITLELSAADMHLVDRSIESFNVCEIVHVKSPPHNFDGRLLCNKQSFDLLNPGNDSVTLGAAFTNFTALSARNALGLANIQSWSGRLNRAWSGAKQANASLTDVVARLDALYAAGYILINLRITGATEELLASTGRLTANGHRVTTGTAQIAATTGSVSVVFTLDADPEGALFLTVNGTTLGPVSKAGDSVSTTITDLADGGTVLVEFTGEAIE